MTDSTRWLLDRWAEENARTLESLTDIRPAASCNSVPPEASAAAFKPGTIYLEVTISLAANALFWVAVPPEAAEALGKRTLEAAGIEDAGSEEIKNTCLELVQQAHGGLTDSISGRFKRAISSKGREVESITTTDPVYGLHISFPDSPPITMFVVLSPGLLTAFDPPAAAEAQTNSVASENRSVQTGTSKTFEALLDVSMPVSISFGRTEMIIKDVLKLNTGSIVELNRTLNEPVDVLINDRVIARGEVVVVDGNYGVRINHIVSRQERFRSSTQVVASKTETSQD